ncbi:MAG: invasion associated locus B family protein [Hoeflea sp.]|nr:invasion associated locus B family protein [Hoeflea sp.]MBV1723323.1 invasion associated locus B family protein [Hoeflea sp.]MBV1760302.1 invasion associated locus B family protein [Hoeflea sp.]
MAPAFAQTTARPSATTEAPKSNWSVNCGAGETADAPLVCQMMQNVVVQESNQRLLTVVVRPQSDSPNHTLTLALPHGVDFIKGVDVVVDDKEPFTVPVQTSNPQGAFSNLPISDKLLGELKAGTSIKFSFQSVSGQSFSVPISLIGFSAAYEKLTSS